MCIWGMFLLTLMRTHFVPPAISFSSNEPALTSWTAASPLTGDALAAVLKFLWWGAKALRSDRTWRVGGWNFKVSYTLLRRVIDMFRIKVDLGDIEAKAKALDEQINQAISKEPKLQGYLNKLEEGFGKKEVSKQAEELIKEIQEFLKGQIN